MRDANKIWGIVAAAGVGARMGGATPKQYLQLRGRRVIDHALAAVCASAVSGVIVGLRAGDEYWRAQPFAHAKVTVSRGGDTRARTVLNALRQLRAGRAAADDWALVHDAARPCVAPADIARVIDAARANGRGAALALPVNDALKRVGDADGAGAGVIEASVAAGAGATYWRAATPQMFRCGALADALKYCIDGGIAPADECQAMEAAGVRAAVVAGHPANIKITVPADLELAAAYLTWRDAGAGGGGQGDAGRVDSGARGDRGGAGPSERCGDEPIDRAARAAQRGDSGWRAS